MTHRNAPLSIEGRRRLAQRCRTRPVAHVAAEMGISRQCASKWVNRYRQFGEVGLADRSSVPHRQLTATPVQVVTRIEALRRTKKWSARRIAFELSCGSEALAVRTVTRTLNRLVLNRRRFIDPNGADNRTPRPIVARRPGHMIHVDVKKVGRIPDGGGWRAHGRNSAQAKVVGAAKKRGVRAGYVYLHSAVDGYSRLAYTKALGDKKLSQQSDSWNAPERSSTLTASSSSYGSSPTTAPAIEPATSPSPAWCAAPADPALHTTSQRKSGALQQDPGRGVPLRPRVDFRTSTIRSSQGLERSLQLSTYGRCSVVSWE